jgi:pimeloyl-ACP methyl ester carboxylesterase
MGDGLREAEAALLWVKHQASEELNLSIERVFIGGHSQGGYIVTRLNTMHETDGVIANAPGPLDLEFRCLLEERGQIAPGRECNLMQAEFGLPSEHPDPYIERSLLSFTDSFKSDILFVQGLNDGPIQMRSWPMFQDAVQRCANCQGSQFVNIPGAGHDALFSNAQVRGVFNQFIQSRR